MSNFELSEFIASLLRPFLTSKIKTTIFAGSRERIMLAEEIIARSGNRLMKLSSSPILNEFFQSKNDVGDKYQNL